MKNQKKWIGRITVLVIALMMMFSTGVLAASPKLNKKKLTLNVGSSYTLKLKNYTGDVIWKSSNYVRASISTSGRVVARKKGTVKLTAVTETKKYTCTLTIKQPVTKVKLNKTSYELQAGNSYTLKATVTPSNANNKKLTWKSSNKSVATVSSAGKVKAKKAGTVTITATAKDGSKKYGSCTITVTPKPEDTYKESDLDTSGIVQLGQSEAANKFLAALQMMSDQVKSDYAKGTPWVYGETNNHLWEKEVAEVASGGVGSVVCSEIVRYAMTEAGIFTQKMHLYAKTNGYFKLNKALLADPDFDKKYEIITVNKTPNQLLKEGNLLPGDVCGWGNVYHTNIYAGNGKWYDAGRGMNTVYKNGKYYFKSFGPSSGWMTSKVVQIFRLK